MFDIVPAYTEEFWGKTYYIPDCGNSWRSTTPNDINDSLASKNTQYGNNVICNTIRLCKHWNAGAGYPLESYLMEKDIINLIYWGDEDTYERFLKTMNSFAGNKSGVRQALAFIQKHKGSCSEPVNEAKQFESLQKLLPKTKTIKALEQPELNRERIAAHEAAHGVLWYLFKDKWTVNSLTIERNGLPDDRMNGALHTSPNFNETENSIERANKLFAIALAGLIGQNINVLQQRQNLLLELMHVNHFNQILDETGCGGDYKIARLYLPRLGQAFKTSEGDFTKYKILDLVTMFQDHAKVIQVHALLSQLLLDNDSLN